MKDNKELLEGLKAGLGNGLKFTVNGYDVDELQGISLDVEEVYGKDGKDYGIAFVKPYFFPLSMLTKPIKVSGYNDGEEFTPYDKLFFGSDEDVHKQGEWFLEQIQNGKGRHAAMLLPHFKVLAMRKMMLNVNDLDTEKFIDASISKVYEKP